MNDEHKCLLEYMNHLFEVDQSKAPIPEQKKILDKLKDATVEHFKHEEVYMEKIGWENLASHRYIHQTLLENFNKHYTKFSEEGKFSDEFFHFLKFWLSAHIQGIDKKYGDFAQAKKAS
jgi:hemerythrin